MTSKTLTEKLEIVLDLFPFMSVQLLENQSLAIHTGEYPSHLALDNALDRLEDLQETEKEQ